MRVSYPSSSARSDDRVRDRGTSSVAGVFFLVAVTLVVSGVVVVGVFGMELITPSPPQATFEYDFTDDGDADALVITHHSGDQIPGDRLFVVVSDGAPAEANDEYRWDGDELAGAATVTSGASVEMNATTVGDGSSLNLDNATVRLVWRSGMDNQSAVVSQWRGSTPSNRAPNAVFTYQQAGESNKVILRATPSTDPDGSITAYEWDTDGNGVYDESGEVVVVAGVPSGASVTLRVTDDDGATDTTFAHVASTASSPAYSERTHIPLRGSPP